MSPRIPAGQPRVVHVLAAVPTPRSETFLIRRLAGARYHPTALHFGVVEGGLSVPCPAEIVSSGARLGLPRRAGRLASAVAHLDTFRRLRVLAPDVVHAHFGTVGTRVDRACALLGIPLVVSFYGFDVGKAPREARVRAKYRRMFANAAAVTGEAPELVRQLEELGVPSAKLRVLPLCLPAWALAIPERRVSWDAKPLRLLQIARFVEKKGIDLSLRALKIARDRGVQVELTLVGDGSLATELRRLAADLKLGAAVSWAGFLPYEALPKLFAEAHVLLQPSRTASDGDTEGGHPTTLIEAAAQGVPVIGSTHADLPFAVRHEETGLLAPEEDVGQLAEFICRLANEPETLTRMGDAARRHALEHHHPDRILRLRESIYDEAVRGAGPSRSVPERRSR